MANKINWRVGHSGKGNVYDDGEISTWNVDAEGYPHHQDVAAQDNKRAVFFFYISPEGGVNDGGVTFNNTSSANDESMVGSILAADQMLYDGRDDPLLSEAPARYELEGGGYGHAHNLLKTFSRIARLIEAEEDKSNWADFHTEFKIPRHIRKQIRSWADKLEWPEGSELSDARRYHITVLSMDEYCPEMEEWMRDRVKGRTFEFKSTGMDIFGDAVVLRLECPAWDRLAVKWGEEAYNRGLSPRRFPGGPKCHISVGTTVDGKWPQGVPDPHVEFDTGKFNVNKNSASPPQLTTPQEYAQHNFDYTDRPESKEFYYPEGYRAVVPSEGYDPLVHGMDPRKGQVFMTGDPAATLMYGFQPPFNIYKVNTEGIPWANAQGVGQRIEPERISLHHEVQTPEQFEALKAQYAQQYPNFPKSPDGGDFWIRHHMGAVFKWPDDDPRSVDNPPPYEPPTEIPPAPYPNTVYHVAPTDARPQIAQEGYNVQGGMNAAWAWPSFEQAHQYAHGKNMDIWGIDADTHGPFKQVPDRPEGHWAWYPNDPEAKKFQHTIPMQRVANKLAAEDQLDIGSPEQVDSPQAQELPMDELVAWLESHGKSIESDTPSIHHNTVDDMFSQQSPHAATGDFIDPPSHPHQPYDWAAEKTARWDGSWDKVVAAWETTEGESKALAEQRPRADAEDDEGDAVKEYHNSERAWYDRAWAQPGDAMPFPPQPHHWRDDHAKNPEDA